MTTSVYLNIELSEKLARIEHRSTNWSDRLAWICSKRYSFVEERLAFQNVHESRKFAVATTLTGRAGWKRGLVKPPTAASGVNSFHRSPSRMLSFPVTYQLRTCSIKTTSQTQDKGADLVAMSTIAYCWQLIVSIVQVKSDNPPPELLSTLPDYVLHWYAGPVLTAKFAKRSDIVLTHFRPPNGGRR